MALVRLKRNWFGPNAVRYRSRDGLIQIPDELVPLVPSDAEVYDDNGKSLPSKSLEPLPGFGAKPLHELNLDLIPGGAPVHLAKVATSEGPDIPLSAEEQKKHDDAAKVASEKLRDTRPDGKTAEEAHKEEQAAVTTGIAQAQAAKEAQDKVLDPIEHASKQSSTVKK